MAKSGIKYSSGSKKRKKNIFFNPVRSNTTGSPVRPPGHRSDRRVNAETVQRIEPARLRFRVPVQPVRPAGPGRVWKHWLEKQKK
jgi:hypothetical protein